MPAKILQIFIAPVARAPMQPLESVEAIQAQGLAGDRYVAGAGSWNRGKPGKRQVTFVDAALTAATFLAPEHTRRNVVTAGIDLNALADNPGKRFRAGTAVFASVKYCSPCEIPGELGGYKMDYGEAASRHRAGGLVAEVLESGVISVEDEIVLLD